MRRRPVLLLPGILLTVAGMSAPPIAARVEHFVKFGRVDGEARGANPMSPAVELRDDLFWLRDDTRSSEAILDLLRRENSYTEHRTAHLDAFRGAVYDEMLSHLQETAAQYPTPADDGYEYWTRTIKGQNYKLHVRRRRGAGAAADDEEVVLDINAVALTLPPAEQSHCAVSEVVPSPAGSMLAFTVDESGGYETYAIRLKDLSSGEDLPVQEWLHGASGDITWLDESTFFYVTPDDAHRPYQVWRHRVGEAQASDVLVYEDADALFNVACWRSRDGALVFLSSESSETSEVSYVASATPAAPPTLVRPRSFGVRLSVDSHAPSRSLFLTSTADGAYNRQLSVASLDEPSRWRPVLGADGAPLLGHSPARSLDGVHAFRDFLAVTGREEGSSQVWVVPLGGGGAADGEGGAGAAAAAHRLSFASGAACSAEVWAADNLRFDPAGVLRVEFESMTAPRKLLAFDVVPPRTAAGGAASCPSYSHADARTLHVQPVPGYDESRFRSSRIHVEARDGVRVPVTLLWRAALPAAPAADGGDDDAAPPLPTDAPLHLYGYGAYGACIDPNFSSARLSLVERGVVFAIAHVRGGGENGHHEWYEKQGKYTTKANTFHDFIDCARGLLARRIARPGSITCEGRSAGGLLIGATLNMAPEGLFRAAIAGVPFVDVMTSMCDSTIPLATEEWEEWGNPNEERFFEYMRSYSPVNNVRPGATYPSLLIVSGLNDPRVAYWEPMKWAQVLRASIANGDDVLLKMDLQAGHFSASDRYRYLRELAFDYAWLLDQHGLAPARGGGRVEEEGEQGAAL